MLFLISKLAKRPVVAVGIQKSKILTKLHAIICCAISSDSIFHHIDIDKRRLNNKAAQNRIKKLEKEWFQEDSCAHNLWTMVFIYNCLTILQEYSFCLIYDRRQVLFLRKLNKC